MTDLHIVIYAEKTGSTLDDQDFMVARVLRKLAVKIATEGGIEAVNCDLLRDPAGNEVGEVYLVTGNELDQRYLSDMAQAIKTGSTANGASLSSAVGHYLATIGHPDAPDWAKKSS